MEINELIKLGIKMFEEEEKPLSEISRKLKINKDLLQKELVKLGYKPGKGLKTSYVIALKKAVDEYILNLDNNPSLTKIGEKYGIERHSFSRRLKELGIEVINHQNKLKFDNTVFDSIDTEEKAYWLGFIYADGYVSSNNNKFELSLKADDINHLEKFNLFIKGSKDKVKINKVKCNETICLRCRINLSDEHFRKKLIELGCVPNKSLILQFPDINIFKSENLIKHFIRGYWDGDGCLSWTDKEHREPAISLLGTEHFLLNTQNNLPLKHLYSLRLANYNTNNKVTKTFSISGKNAYLLTKYLYEDSTIYLDRKYEKYKEYCRLYEESYKELVGNNGEDCDVNPVITKEIKESLVSYSVEGETV